MRIQSLVGVAMWLGALLSVSCGPKHTADSGSRIDPAAVKALLVNPDTIDFAAVQRFVLNANCLSCHGPRDAKNGIDLSTFELLIEGRNDRVLVVPFDPGASNLINVLEAQGKRHMPPLDHPQLTQDQIQLVYSWIAGGAKRTQASTVSRRGTLLKDKLLPFIQHPETIDYPVIRKYVLAATCIKCHSLQGDAPDKDAIANFANLTDYRSLFSIFTPIVVKGKPHESKLYQSTAITQSMPPPKDGYDPVDSLRLKVLRLWILNCAIESKSALGNEQLQPDPDNPSEKLRNCEI